MDAVSLAQKLSGVSGGCPLHWINTFSVSYIIPTEDEEPGQEAFFEADHTALQPEDAVLVDILTAGVTGGDDDDTDTIMDDLRADLCWQTPEVRSMFAPLSTLMSFLGHHIRPKASTGCRDHYPRHCEDTSICSSTWMSSTGVRAEGYCTSRFSNCTTQ
jgi:hypothetical protein